MERKFEWTVIESKQLFKDRWADIKVETCEKPDGGLVTPFYVYTFPDYACAVAITKDGQVILERMYRHGLKTIAVELPGGCIDKTDVSFEAAIARELYEETGYKFEHIEYLGSTSPNPTTNTNLMRMFLATGGIKDENAILDAEEDVEVFLVSMEKFLSMLQQKDFIQSMHVTTIYAALEKLGLLKIG